MKKDDIALKNYEKVKNMCDPINPASSGLFHLFQDSPEWFKTENWDLHEYVIAELFCFMLNVAKPELLFNTFSQNIIEHGLETDEKTRSTMFKNYLDAVRKVEGGVTIICCIHELLICDKEKFDKYTKCCEIFWNKQGKLLDYFNQEEGERVCI